MKSPALQTRPFKAPHKNCAGFTLLELLLTMGILIMVIMISSGAFEKIAKLAVVQSSGSVSNIQGIVGLEVMRSDLEHAGFGLPWPVPSSGASPFDYEESKMPADSLAPGINPQAFNNKNNPSADPEKTPRAVESASSNAGGPWEKGRDYLVIRGTWHGMSATSKRWSYLEGVGSGSSIKEWGNASEEFGTSDRLVTLRTVTVDHKVYRELVTSGGNFSYQLPARTAGKLFPPAGFQAATDDLYLVYGVADTDLRYPYNRVDYFIRRPSDDPSVEPGISPRCAPGTGVLYKANVIHNVNHVNPNRNSGGVDQYPLLECVADMQVVYSLDTNGDGGVDMHGDEDILANMTAEDIRNQLKEIRVYLLAHEGGVDTTYNFPSSSVRVGGFGLGRDYDLTKLEKIGTSWRNYRWKVYTIAVEPKNINN